MSEEIKDFSLPNPLAISGAILNPLKPPFAQGRGTETVVKIWFLDCKPYSGNEEATRKVINETFIPVPARLRDELIAVAFQPYQDVANVRFELATSESEANVRIGMCSASIDQGGCTVPSGEKRDIFVCLQKGQTSPNLAPNSNDAHTFKPKGSETFAF